MLAGFSGADVPWLVVGLTTLVFCAFSIWFMLQLYKQNGRLLQRVEVLEGHASGHAAKAPTPTPPGQRLRAGLPLGTPAPNFELSDIAGKSQPMQSLLAGNKPLMLLFVDPDCGPCKAMLPSVEHWHHEYAGKVTVVLVSRGSARQNSDKIGFKPLPNMLLQRDREVASAFQCYGTPGAVWITPDGNIKSHLAQGSVEIERLFFEEINRSAVELQSTYGVGDSAPGIALPNLSGKRTKLADFAGIPMVILFWSTACGFCSQILHDLRDWERDPNSSRIRLLVVSSGSADANRQMGLLSEVVLDQEFLVGKAFRSTGTPSAVLLDEQGVVSGTVVTGGQAVLSLLKLASQRDTVSVGNDRQS